MTSHLGDTDTDSLPQATGPTIEPPEPFQGELDVKSPVCDVDTLLVKDLVSEMKLVPARYH